MCVCTMGLRNYGPRHLLLIIIIEINDAGASLHNTRPSVSLLSMLAADAAFCGILCII